MATQAPRVLVVDPARESRAVLETVLVRAGMSVVSAWRPPDSESPEWYPPLGERMAAWRAPGGDRPMTIPIGASNAPPAWPGSGRRFDLAIVDADAWPGSVAWAGWWCGRSGAPALLLGTKRGRIPLARGVEFVRKPYQYADLARKILAKLESASRAA